MREKTAVTIRDVAKQANVGIGTVSRVLNKSSEVSDETRDRVMAAIEELSYIPNPIARQLAIGRTLTIGIFLPYLTLPSYIERLRGVQHILASSEYDLVIFNVENPKQRNAYFRDYPQKSGVDGMLIVSLPPSDEQAEHFANSRSPVVLIDSDHPSLCCIVADDLEGGRLATRHLLDLGHKRIGYMSDYLDTPFHPAMRLRYQGFCEVHASAGIPVNPNYVIEGDRGRVNARSMAKKLLVQPDPPTAIFAASDMQGIGVLDAARELGLKIPEQLSVIGYDGIQESEDNELTTIDQNLYDSGVRGAKLLLSRLSNAVGPPNKEYVPVELMKRKTTAPPL